MVQIERSVIINTELGETPKAQVVIFGESPGVMFIQVSDQITRRYKIDKNKSEIVHLENLSAFENTISKRYGVQKIGNKQAIFVGDTFQQRNGGLYSTLDIDKSGLINRLREVCSKHDIGLVRFKRNPDGALDFIPENI